MANIAVLGMGAMGSRMASGLLRGGHRVTVWNRTRRSGERISGAVVADTPRAAVAGAEFAVGMVRDDDASRRIWLDPVDGALAGLRPDAVLIESSTLSVPWVEQLARRCADAGVAMLDAPVVGSRPQADAGRLIHLVGGDPAAFGRSEPVLATMGTAHHIGPVGSGAVVKLVVNALYGVQVAALAEVIGYLRRTAVPLERAIDALAATPACGPAAQTAAVSMIAEAFDPMFPVELIEKDLGYLMSAARAVHAHAPMADAAHRLMQTAMAKGLGARNLTSVATLFR